MSNNTTNNTLNFDKMNIRAETLEYFNANALSFYISTDDVERDLLDDILSRGNITEYEDKAHISSDEIKLFLTVGIYDNAILEISDKGIFRDVPIDESEKAKLIEKAEMSLGNSIKEQVFKEETHSFTEPCLVELYNSTTEHSLPDRQELHNHLDMNGYETQWNKFENFFIADKEQLPYIETILNDKNLEYDIKENIGYDDLKIRDFIIHSEPQEMIIEVPDNYGPVDIANKELWIEYEAEIYEGGTDLNGHERKDNFSLQQFDVQIMLGADEHTVYVDTFSHGADDLVSSETYDITDEDGISALNKKIEQIMDNEVQKVYTTNNYNQPHEYKYQTVLSNKESSQQEKAPQKAKKFEYADN